MERIGILVFGKKNGFEIFKDYGGISEFIGKQNAYNFFIENCQIDTEKGFELKSDRDVIYTFSKFKIGNQKCASATIYKFAKDKALRSGYLGISIFINNLYFYPISQILNNLSYALYPYFVDTENEYQAHNYEIDSHLNYDTFIRLKSQEIEIARNWEIAIPLNKREAIIHENDLSFLDEFIDYSIRQEKYSRVYFSNIPNLSIQIAQYEIEVESIVANYDNNQEEVKNFTPVIWNTFFANNQFIENSYLESNKYVDSENGEVRHHSGNNSNSLGENINTNQQSQYLDQNKSYPVHRNPPLNTEIKTPESPIIIKFTTWIFRKIKGVNWGSKKTRVRISALTIILFFLYVNPLSSLRTNSDNISERTKSKQKDKLPVGKSHQIQPDFRNINVALIRSYVIKDDTDVSAEFNLRMHEQVAREFLKAMPYYPLPDSIQNLKDKFDWIERTQLRKIQEEIVNIHISKRSVTLLHLNNLMIETETIAKNENEFEKKITTLEKINTESNKLFNSISRARYLKSSFYQKRIEDELNRKIKKYEDVVELTMELKNTGINKNMSFMLLKWSIKKINIEDLDDKSTYVDQEPNTLTFLTNQ